MGVISILLGVIAFIGFTGAGAVLGNQLIEWKVKFSGTFLKSFEGVTNTSVMVAAIGLFGFIGLLICINMVMNGLTYNKVNKIQKRLRHL